MPTLNVPLRNQLAYSAGHQSSAENNCGPTCLSMVWEYLTGTFINPDRIHDEIRVDGHGDWHTGYMFFPWLGWWVENAKGRAWYWRTGQSDSAYLASIRNEIDKGHPVIILTVFNKHNLTGGHFVVVRGYYYKDGVTHFQINDPYGGFYDNYTGPELLRISDRKHNGWMVIDMERPSEPSYTTSPERWTAEVRVAFANIRKGPGTRYPVVTRARAGQRLRLTKFTDQGEHVDGGQPPRRWHFTGAGWIADALLVQSSFRPY